MAMTDTERILAYLRSVSPRAATNSEILEGTGIEGRYQGMIPLKRVYVPEAVSEE